jgi:predicted negative regulator of RcsB-dependent stress response
LRTLESLNLDEDDTFSGSKVYIYWSFAVEQTKAGDTKGAVEFAGRLRDAGAEVTVLLQIAKTQAEQKKLDDARTTIKRAELRFQDLRDEGQKDDYYSSFAAAYIRAGERDRALASATVIKDQLSRVLALLEIAKTQIRANNPKDAQVTLKQALPAAYKLSAHHPLAPTAFRWLCESLGQIDTDADAIALIDRCEAPILKANGWLGLAQVVAIRISEAKKPSASLEP